MLNCPQQERLPTIAPTLDHALVISGNLPLSDSSGPASTGPILEHLVCRGAPGKPEGGHLDRAGSVQTRVLITELKTSLMTSELIVLNYPHLHLRSGCIYNTLLPFIK